MLKSEFKQRFNDALELAAVSAEQRLGKKVCRNFRVRLYGAGHSGDLLDPAEAVDSLYLGENKFYRIIDVSIIEVGSGFSTVFVRASSHKPASFERTWNNPPGSGPFKQLIAERIKVLE
jgi:hypothetical protein